MPRRARIDAAGALQHPDQDRHAAAAERISRSFQPEASAHRPDFSYVEKAVAVGRRPELTGGGLIRSVGGWGSLKSLGKEPRRVQARSLACYWGVRELGMTTVAVSKVLGICPTEVTKAVSRGELFAKSREIGLEK
jgi:hypothetical protein